MGGARARLGGVSELGVPPSARRSTRMGSLAETAGLTVMSLHSPFQISAKRAGAAVLIAALASLAACDKSDSARTLDESLKADLAAAGGHADASFELAPSSARSLTVISAIEGGPKATPTRVTPARAPQVTTRQVKRQTTPKQTVAATPAPTEAASEPTPAPVETETPAISAPRPAAAAAQQQDRRVYKTEAEIFRQMPWIRP